MAAARSRAFVPAIGRLARWGRVAAEVTIGLVRLVRAIPLGRPSTYRIIWRDGLTISALVSIAAVKDPTGIALIDDDGPVSYSELDRLADAQAYEMVPNARYAVSDANHRSFVIAVCGALRVCADVVLLDPTVPGRQPLSALQRSRPRKGPGRVVLQTSGSTGQAKEVERGDVRLGQAVPVTSLVRWLPLKAGAPMVVTSPLWHGFGLGFLALGLAFGMPVVVGRRVDAARVAAYLKENPGCVLVGVPPVLARVERAGGAAEVAAVVSGAGLLHPSVAARLTASYGPVLFNLYGSSEEGWSTIARPVDIEAAPGTIGRPAAGVRVAVLDDDGRPLPPYEVGHLCVSSRLEFEQYSGGGRRPRLGGLADSGDLGHRDEAGRFFVDGRADDMVVTGGENVFLTEVEDVLLRHPAVAEARVDGVPDEEFGARLEASVVLRAAATADEVIAFARERLARAKVPRKVTFVESLPATSTGKPGRRVT
ncbi:acyl-CoA synthetase (AMP-forming)/AMP-acid ligase II [Kribbella orskensis]|uniref:Acyl-CoA synthetase (AMP-forming)/AMP-acid ligase II n=1 Tax=Kribbella orskensis TaxID=2512216 RepID=A0ABY2BHV3_9ACTN|nr:MULTISPECIES: AMP-binding protein [Kribbella]TCN38229.1 acyl-CoA synthetase (AMP-forming)/AMP-acid ligase II [Kribbella sp. VKM Ac-2500]TCO20241.1 acyl-CoA synthetase (AMP-forming)/AMP-acid ligase II [Kribbella orskensis]